MCVSNVQCSLLSDFNCKWDTKVCSVGFNENALSSSQVCTCRLGDGERDWWSWKSEFVSNNILLGKPVGYVVIAAPHPTPPISSLNNWLS